MTPRHLPEAQEKRPTLDQMTSDDLDALHAENDRLTAELADYDQRNEQLEAAAEQHARNTLTVAGERDSYRKAWKHEQQRRAHAEAAIARVRAACEQLRRASVLTDGQPHTDRERGAVQAVTRILAALDAPAPGPAATQATEAADITDPSRSARCRPPGCGAQPGEPCRRHDGTPTSVSHGNRWREYDRQRDATREKTKRAKPKEQPGA